ncbi:MAG: B12-binding domain-containing radical SAM protein [Planctomycetales bacterium]|nr:B12-binding domain-containing radical SAM protein [Planctomycetales bacterium]
MAGSGTAGRIGLIAVSGVRIYNDRLVRHGITLPGFVERARVIASMPSLGLLTLAAVTPERFSITYLERPEFDAGNLPDFDIVAVSSFTAKSSVMYRIADAYRARGTPVVLGGLHATLLPEEAALHADAVVAGEGEALWPRVLADWEAGRLGGIYRNSSVRDVVLGANPPPRYDLLDPSAYNRLPVQTARGCPLHCEFCAASRIYGRYKVKPVEAVVREIREIKKVWRHPFVELADDNTFVDKRWSRDLVRAIADEEVHWFTETDVSVADDPELLDLLARSGCRQLLIGFESPRAESLNGLEAGNWKLRRLDQYRRAIEEIQSRGITVNGCFIVGLDEDTPGSFEEIERFVKSTSLLEVQVTVLTPFPGTALYRRLKAEGRLLRDGDWDHCTLFDVNFVPKRMSVEELEQGLEWLMGTLYSAEETRARRRRFLDLWRGARKEAAA